MQPYQEAAGLCQRIGARREEGVIAFSLGTAYKNIPGLRDLDQAEHWYQHDLELQEEHDALGRAETLGLLGNVAHERSRRPEPPERLPNSCGGT